MTPGTGAAGARPPERVAPGRPVDTDPRRAADARPGWQAGHIDLIEPTAARPDVLAGASPVDAEVAAMPAVVEGAAR